MAEISEMRDEEDLLVAQIEQEIRNIYVTVEKLYNNISNREPLNPIEKALVTNCCFSTSLSENGIDDTITSSSFQTLKESFQHELDCLISDIDEIVIRKNEKKEILKNIDEKISNLNKMKEALKENKNDSSENMDNILRKVKQCFKKEKADLKSIITTLFVDDLDIQDLIARIIEHHFTEGADKYLQLEKGDNINEQIELLRRTNLFQINPHDILQIRLADLL